MDSNSLLNEQIEAGAEFVDRLCQAMPIRTAFWLLGAEASRWYLYIVADAGPDGTRGEPISRVNQVQRQMHSPYLEFFRVIVLTPNDPLARDMLDMLRMYPVNAPIRNNEVRYFGGMDIKGYYIYPIPNAVAVA